MREVAQVAAVIGRSFSHDLLAAVSTLAPEDLEHALERLTDAALIFRDGPAFLKQRQVIEQFQTAAFI